MARDAIQYWPVTFLPLITRWGSVIALKKYPFTKLPGLFFKKLACLIMMNEVCP